MLDSTRLIVVCGLLLWAGLTLLLSELRWFRRVSLIARLKPYAGPSVAQSSSAVTSFREAITPLLASVGERIAKLFGVSDDLSVRLRRAQIDSNVSAFRMRQFSWSMASVALVALFGLSLSLPPAVTIFFLLSSPLLVFLLLEQQIISATQKRQKRLFAELPVVAEQLATLLGAGYSLGSALSRLAERNKGATGDDLRVVVDRMKQGLSTAAALKEWAELAGVPEISRLASVLSFSSETTELNRLVSAEAEAIRKESQRRLAELIDKRAQQVWIPVTIATLVPGVIFLSIPFLQALDQFSTN